MKRKFIVIGISDSRRQIFPPDVLSVIKENRVFAGGMRHRDIMQQFLPDTMKKWIDITVPLEDTFNAFMEEDTCIVVFASGDPLFYGFANTLMNRFPDSYIKVFPTFNSLQLLAHKLTMPYNDLTVVSLTGRDWPAFDEALICGKSLIGVLTDRVHTPNAIARRMSDYGYYDYDIYLGEALGNEEKERIRKLSVVEAEQLTDFSFPNCLLLKKTALRNKWFGIPDNEFHLLDGRSKMITKMPIRLADLALLDLKNKTSLWDIGFCTGSVSIEARLQFPHLHITAFEVRPEGEELMRLNARKFGAPGITAIHADFLEGSWERFPAPDAVFIGGHNGRLVEMIASVKSYLKPGGEILFNSVSKESLDLFEKGVAEAGMKITASTRIAVDSFNPIEIRKAK